MVGERRTLEDWQGHLHDSSIRLLARKLDRPKDERTLATGDGPVVRYVSCRLYIAHRTHPD